MSYLLIRFKKELSVLFPTNSLENERFIIERIRQFYQSRGSKESFQFLFRILFNKDSDIFYPSTQILRASDGKWIQEKSVFVEISEGNLFNLSGKNIYIETNKKKIYVYCPRVDAYSQTIYEVFIDRAYVQDISIGDKVSSEDGLNYGNILPCPNRYTVVKKGSGFEIGKLYHLKTEKGDGSLIKITKIGTGGSIEKVQLISLGLDYDSTFYATLSNKTATAIPYYHPITQLIAGENSPNTSYGPNSNPYPDTTSGTLDLGYINIQDYFFYDNFYIPTGVVGGLPAQYDKFYSTATYAGKIIGTFYTNSFNENVIDDTAAEIKVELGPVAVYPGYYSSSDGFISDESYIQDGKYYQLFSYVVKVEQQIDSYYDIVKSLLHPAGMELFAEYTIKNNYVVSATPLLAFIRRQFFEQVFSSDDDANNAISKIILPSTVSAIHNFLEDVKNISLSIRKYNSDWSWDNVSIPQSGYVDETDQNRWSTADTGTNNYYDMNKGSREDPTENALVETNDDFIPGSAPYEYNKSTFVSVRKYDANQLDTGETDQLRWSLVLSDDTFIPGAFPYQDRNRTILSIQRYDSTGAITSETDTRRWSLAIPNDTFIPGAFPYQNEKSVALSVRKYDVNQVDTGETDQLRWSIVDVDSSTYHPKHFAFQSIDGGSFYKTVGVNEENNRSTTISIRKYDSSKVDTGETDTRRWSIVDVDSSVYHPKHFDIQSTEGGTFYKTVNVDSSVYHPKHFAFQSIDGGTFYSTTSVASDFTGEQDTKRTTLSIRKYDSNQVDTGETDTRRWSLSSAVGGGWNWNGVTYDLITPEIDKTTNYVRRYMDPSVVTSGTTNGDGDYVISADFEQGSSIKTTLSIRKYDSNQVDTGETDTRRWSLSSAVGGGWNWNGVTYVLINPEILISALIYRSPNIELTGTVTAGSNILNITSGAGITTNSTTNGLFSGIPLVKVSGAGAFGAECRIESIESSTQIRMSVNATSSGSIVFTYSGGYPEFAQILSSPLDSFPDGSNVQLSKFSFSGGTWADNLSLGDLYNQTNTYSRSFAEPINSISSGTLYKNVYSQNTSDNSTIFSYEAETYSERIITSLN